MKTIKNDSLFVNKNRTKVYIHMIVTSEQSEQSSYYQSYMGRPIDMQSALRPLKKIGNKLNQVP